MKLLTLNTHSLQEADYLEKREWFLDGILQEKPDIVALQEVNQSLDAKLAKGNLQKGQFLLPGETFLRQDNYGAWVADQIWQAGISCFWAWLPIKVGYEKYEEGVALLCLNRKIAEVDICYISGDRDPMNWRTRAVLGIRPEGMADWFYSVHTGWWEDAESPFSDQWERLEKHLQEKKKRSGVWLMGDFNAPDTAVKESYEHILSKGWKDTYSMADIKDKGITVRGNIDGWRGKKAADMRLDYIFCNREEEIESTEVLFNGRNRPIVSDHFAVMIQTKEK